MNRLIRMIAAIMAVLVMMLGACALAEGMISTSVVMRVSKMTQNAVVNAGEDLSMEVNIDGIEPDSYQWYFEDQRIEGARQKVYCIVNAQVENSGIYRMEAFDASGKMLVSMDISARVIDLNVPQSGDDSLPVAVPAAMFAAAGAVMLCVFRRKAEA